MNELEEYLKMTGQDEQVLMAGVSQYGPAYVDDLISQALKEKKKVVFIEDPDSPYGYGTYELQSI